MAFAAFSEALSIVFTWPTPLWVVIGLTLGMIAGALPGSAPRSGWRSSCP